MASLTRASQEAFRTIKPWIGLGRRRENDDQPAWRSSFSSVAVTLVGSDHTENIPPNKESQRETLNHDGRKGWSKTLRSVASFFYIDQQESEDEPDFWFTSQHEIPERKRTPHKAMTWHRSSPRLTGSARDSRSHKCKHNASDFSISPSRIVQNETPTLNVPIPTYSLRRKTSNVSICDDLDLCDPATYQSDDCSEDALQTHLASPHEPTLIIEGGRFPALLEPQTPEQLGVFDLCVPQLTQAH